MTPWLTQSYTYNVSLTHTHTWGPFGGRQASDVQSHWESQQCFLDFSRWISVCPGALASPETCRTSPAGVVRWISVKPVKTCHAIEAALFLLYSGLFQNLQFVLRRNLRVWPRLQASHTRPSRCHSFHFLQSKVMGVSGPAEGQVQPAGMLSFPAACWCVVWLVLTGMWLCKS